ncbi:MAG TPA: PAS domain S-box protein [Coleofasciculaceae cyanobacterium]
MISASGFVAAISNNSLQALPLAGLLLLLAVGLGLLIIFWLAPPRLHFGGDIGGYRFSFNVTKLKQVEAALRQSETFNRAILDALPDLIIRMHRDGTYLDIKPTTAFPIDFPNFRLGENIRNFLPPEAAEQRLAAAAKALQTGEVQVYEFPLLVQGQDLWQEARVVPLNPDEVLVVIRDLTQRHQVEAALRISEARLAMAQQVAQVGYWEFDLESQKRTWSDISYQQWGVAPTQPAPSLAELFEIVHPDDRAALQHSREQTITQRVPYALDLRVVHPDGSIRYLDSRAEPLLNAQGQVVKIVGTSVDITKRKQAEAALQASETRFRQLAETVQEGFFIYEIESAHYSYVNSAYADILGIPTQSLYTGMSHWLKQIHPDDRDRIEAALERERQGENFHQEYRFIRPSGERCWLRSQAFPLRNQTGVPVRIVGTVEDISDRKQLEQSLRSQAEAERLLATITQNIRQSLDLGQILDTAVIQVQQTLKADRVLIFRLNQDGSGQVIQEAVVPPYPVTAQMRWEDEHFPNECYAYYSQGIPRIVPNVGTDKWSACLAEFMQAMNVKSKVVAPIVQVGENLSPQVWGLLVVHACSDYRQWQAAEADFLQQICNQLAVAIDQANLYQKLQAELAERKQVEKALQEREAMLRAIGDNLPKGFIYQQVHEPGRGFYYSYISAGIEQLLGIKPEDVIKDPQTIRHISCEEELALADQILQESLKTLAIVEIQMQHRTVQGKMQWSSIRSVPRRLDDGRTVWDGVEVDITDIKRIETALRTSEEQFRKAFENAPIGVSLVDPTGHFVKVNPRYCHLLGYTEAELLALNFRDITHPADVEADLAGFEQMMAGELRFYQVEKRYIDKQGMAIPVLINAAPILDQEGKPLYCVGHVQDMRDRLRVERMKDEFISVVSHELRTPLTSIRGALGILGSGVFNDRPEKANRMLNIAINNSDRLVRLVNDILTLERLESGKVQLVMEQCQVTDLMQQAVDSVQGIADQSGITLTLMPISATLWAAPDAIIQALTNLLSNAIKFSSIGNTVWLKAEIGNGKAASHSSPPNCQLPTASILFIVQDQGRGIPPDRLEVIFEQFQQVDVSDSREKGGTGLGLAICKKIVQQHGGQIWAESILGEGSTFYFVLPLTMKDKSC